MRRPVELIASLYEAAQDPTAWPQVVAEIGKALHAPQVIIAHNDPDAGAWPLVALHGIRDDDWQFYLDEIRDMDPRGAFFRTAPAGTMLVSGRNDDPDALMASVAGQRFYHPRVDGYWVAGLVARQTRRSLVGMVVQRPQRLGMFSEAELETLTEIGAHLDHAVRLASRHAQTTLVAALRGHALDSLAIGVVLLDPVGEVVEMNRRARAMLARQDGLVLTQRRLGALLPQDRALLQRLIAEALERRSTGIPRPGGTLRVEPPWRPFGLSGRGPARADRRSRPRRAGPRRTRPDPRSGLRARSAGRRLARGLGADRRRGTARRLPRPPAGPGRGGQGARDRARDGAAASQAHPAQDRLLRPARAGRDARRRPAAADRSRRRRGRLTRSGHDAATADRREGWRGGCARY
jgi:GAF domain-containing protein